MSQRPTVVIVGAGFGGLYAAKFLRDVPVNILLIDQHNYHTFQPLLYQVATGALSADDIAHQVRAIFQEQRNFSFRQGTVTGVDWDSKCLRMGDDTSVTFDYLILAAGAIYNDFGTPGVREHAFFLKSLSEAVNIRSHVLRQFEKVDADPSLIDKGALNFVLVGGGPTGVEMAGSFVELFDKVMVKDYPRLEPRARVILIEAMDAVLPPFAPASRDYTLRVLRERGIDVRLNSVVAEVRRDAVVLRSGETIPTETLLWAAGVRSSPLADALGVELTRGFRVVIEPDSSIPGKPYAFVIGDMAAPTDAAGVLLPQVAPVAIQQGKHVARMIQRHIAQLPTEPFKYFDKGIMAIIGRGSGVAELSRSFGGFHFQGVLAWLAWLFLHLVYLVGFRNRFTVFTNWIYNYFTYDRHTRLIADMQPSPAEVTNRTEMLVSDKDIAEGRRTNPLLQRPTES